MLSSRDNKIVKKCTDAVVAMIIVNDPDINFFMFISKEIQSVDREIFL